MFEAQFKEHLIRINKLEQELMHSKTEKENLEYEHNNLKKKQEEDKRVIYLICYFLIFFDLMVI